MTTTAPSDSFVSVVIATRNRGAAVVATVRSILARASTHTEICIVDQSDDGNTRAALEPLLADPRVGHLPTATRGVAAARNVGLNATHGEFIAMTDDDCEVTGEWLEACARAFAVDPRIGVVFGNVLPGPHDAAEGFVPAYVRAEPFLARRISDKPHAEGMGACMAVRRTTWIEIGGFDERFGAGAMFRSSEENDFAIRALLAGWRVYETPTMAVVHHGFRPWRDGKTLAAGYLFGVGAMYAKHIGCGNWRILGILPTIAKRWAAGGSGVDLGDRSLRSVKLAAFAKGLLAGFTARKTAAPGR